MKTKIINKQAIQPVFWVLLLAEGFIQAEERDFDNQCRIIKNNLFKITPFQKKYIAIHSSFKPSRQRGMSTVEQDTAYRFLLDENNLLRTDRPEKVVAHIKALHIKGQDENASAANIWLDPAIAQNRLVLVICNKVERSENFMRQPQDSSPWNLGELDGTDSPSTIASFELEWLYPFAAASFFDIGILLNEATQKKEQNQQRKRAGAIFARMIGLAMGLDYEHRSASQTNKYKILGKTSRLELIFELNKIEILGENSLVVGLFESEFSLKLYDDYTSENSEGNKIQESHYYYTPYVVVHNKKWVIKSAYDFQYYIVEKNGTGLVFFEQITDYPNIQTHESMIGRAGIYDTKELKWRHLISGRRLQESSGRFELADGGIDIADFNAKSESRVLFVEQEQGNIRGFSVDGQAVEDRLNIIHRSNNNYKGHWECLMHQEIFEYVDTQGQNQVKRIGFCRVCEDAIHGEATRGLKQIKILKEFSTRGDDGGYPVIASRMAMKFYESVKKDEIVYADGATNGLKEPLRCVDTTVYRFTKFFKYLLAKSNHLKVSYQFKDTLTKFWPYEAVFPVFVNDLHEVEVARLWVSNLGALSRSRRIVKVRAGQGAAGALALMGLGRVKNPKCDYGKVKIKVDTEKETEIDLTGSSYTVKGYTFKDVLTYPDKFQEGSLIQIWPRINETTDKGMPLSENYIKAFSRGSGVVKKGETSLVGHSLVYLGVENKNIRVADQNGNQMWLNTHWSDFNFIIFGEWYDAIF